MVLDAWTQESIDHDTPLWQVPFPHDEGTRWPMYSTAKLGAPGEMPDATHVRRVSVVPAPYTKPHPPVFVASSASRETAEYCARKGFIPTYFAKMTSAAAHGPDYVRWAAEAGHDWAPGQNQAVVRWIQIGEDMADARDKVGRYDAEIQKHFYSQTSPTQHRGDTSAYTREDWINACTETGLWIVGSVEDVKRQYIEQWKPAAGRVRRDHLPLRPAARRERAPQPGAVHDPHQARAGRDDRLRLRRRGSPLMETGDRRAPRRAARRSCSSRTATRAHRGRARPWCGSRRPA